MAECNLPGWGWLTTIGAIFTIDFCSAVDTIHGDVSDSKIANFRLDWLSVVLFEFLPSFMSPLFTFSLWNVSGY